MVTYGTIAIPSDQINVIAGGTVAISAAFENSVGLIGGMDTDNGSATEGDVITVSSPSDALSEFGEESELYEQVQLAFQNGAAEVFALPVAETETTESFSATSSDSLSESPIMDPRVHPDEEITAEDDTGTTITVNIVDDDPPSTPSEADTINLNPVTQDWEADASDDYDITYTFGDYSQDAMSAMVDESPRMIGLLTESDTVINDIVTDVTDRATGFDFMHVVAGVEPGIDDTSYSESVDERRVTRVYPSRGYIDDNETEQQRTIGAVAGHLASLPLGFSSTNDSIGGFTGLYSELDDPTAAGNLIDERVMPLLDYPPVTIVKDMTTSSEPKFERTYQMQIVDEATELSHIISREFVGDPNTAPHRRMLDRSHRNALNDMLDGEPQLLDDYTLSVTDNEADANQVDVSLGLDVVDVMDTIDVTITVGDIIRNNGAT